MWKKKRKEGGREGGREEVEGKESKGGRNIHIRWKLSHAWCNGRLELMLVQSGKTA